MAATAPSEPGTTPTNPITQPGPGDPGQTYATIVLANHPTRTIEVPGPATQATAEAVKLQVDGSTPTPTAAGGHVTPFSDTEGSTVCAWSIASPSKKNATTVEGTAPVNCTSDVYNLQGVLSLYRTTSFILIGQDAENNGDTGSPHDANLWDVTGPCHTSTYIYYDALTYGLCSYVNGCYYAVATHDGVGRYISC